MEIRRPLEWHCKQMDHFVGLNFNSNFNFALVGHLLKGRHVAQVDLLPLSQTTSVEGTLPIVYRHPLKHFPIR